MAGVVRRIFLSFLQYQERVDDDVEMFHEEEARMRLTDDHG